MIPVIALVGRPNVGKSTLFNQLTRSRDALVADIPGLTRDRQYGIGRVGGFPYMVVDTGGLSGEDETMDTAMAQQTRQAIAEADLVLLMVDARSGLGAQDEVIARDLRTQGVRALLVANKTDGLDIDSATAEFHRLGMGGILPIAAAHGRGINALMQRVREEIDARAAESGADEEAVSVGDAEALDRWPGIRVALVGRPNVGKSTLINRLLGEERVVATPIAGTTRDSIFIPFSRDGQDYTLIDTAGIRRRGRVHEVVEKFSVIKTLKAIEAAHVVIMVLDARAGIADQDAHLLGMVLEAGRALVLAVNKWDGLDPDVRESVRQDLERKLGFLRFARMRLVSALHGTNVGHLLEDVREAHASAFAALSTPKLSRLLESAVAEHQPPLVGHRRIKLRYAHQGGQNPPVIVIHGNQTESLPGSYKRFLENFFRTHLKLVGTPLRLEFKTGTNPFAGRRNTLTERQQRKRKRLLQHVKRR
jgi:GTPase